MDFRGLSANRRFATPPGAIVLLTLSVAFAGACGTQDPSFVSKKKKDKIPIQKSADGGPGSLGNEANQKGEFGEDASGGGGRKSGSADATATTGDASGSGSGSADGSSQDNADGKYVPGEEGDIDMPGGEGDITGVERRITEVQSGPGSVDILWVVDDSGSMAEEQNYLGDNFDAMIRELQTAGHDFRTAITTTDVCRDEIPSDKTKRRCPVLYGNNGRPPGQFVGDSGSRILHKDDSDLVERFNRYTNVGISGSGFEHGLKAAQLAIKRSQSGQNESLVRKDSFLAVIVVSDEEDDGIGLSKKDAYNGHNFWEEDLTRFRYTEDDMIEDLRNVKGEGNFSISTITGTRKDDGSMCSAPHSQPKEEGTQYIKAANKTGGIVQSICGTDWDKSLASIGLDLDAQISQISLKSEPYPSTIVVKVDGKVTEEWSYAEGNNAVKFNSGHIPPEGAEIVVTYTEKG